MSPRISPPFSIRPFSIDVADEVLADLRERLRRTRWPRPAPGPPWSQGTDLEYLKGLTAHWADEFDWRAQERDLNRFHHHLAEVDGTTIHFVHERSPRQNAIPIILSNGWPSSFVELLPLVPLLTDPRGPGERAFDVVIPSLPGYGFSGRPRRQGATVRQTAGLWHRLMRGLGYQRYGACGSDFGAGVATFMALDEPASMIGIHLTDLELSPYTGPGSSPLTESERDYIAANQRWADRERGYSAIQSTKPQTVGYGLNDSPAGLAAYVLEKWRSWADTDGRLDARLPRDFLLTTLTLMWATQTITESMRDYFDNRWFGTEPGPDDRVRLPTAFAVFAHHLAPEGEPPREYAERLYNIERWTVMPRGGHFPAVEEPDLLAGDIAAFFTAVARPGAGNERDR